MSYSANIKEEINHHIPTWFIFKYMCLVSIIHIHYFFAYFDLHISHNHNYSYSSMFLYMHKYSLFIRYFMGSMVVVVIHYKYYGKFDKDVIYNFEDNWTHTLLMYRDSPARIMNGLQSDIS